ncbi:MAG: hypothetical protein WCS65_16100 [Verrucomicrobiae bacterium]
MIDAYVRVYTLPQLEAALPRALEAHQTGVTLTTISVDGSSTGGVMSGKPEDIIATLLAAIEAKEAATTGAGTDARVSHWDFSRQILGT